MINLFMVALSRDVYFAASGCMFRHSSRVAHIRRMSIDGCKALDGEDGFDDMFFVKI